MNWKDMQFVGYVRQEQKDINISGELQQFKMPISLWQLRDEIVKSWVCFIFNNSVITDYLFPILFALFTFIYCNIGNWLGTLRNVF